MKKAVLLSMAFLTFSLAHAKLVVRNHTSCDLSFTVFAAGYGVCEGYQSQLYTVPANSNVTIANTEDLGLCYTYPSSYTTLAVPPLTQDWSYVKFYSSTLCNFYGSVGSCVASTTWQSACNWCGSNPLSATWSVSGISTLVDFTN